MSLTEECPGGETTQFLQQGETCGELSEMGREARNGTRKQPTEMFLKEKVLNLNFFISISLNESSLPKEILMSHENTHTQALWS